MTQSRVPYYPQFGERVAVLGCYSEVMVHFKLAGKPIEIAIIPSRYACGIVADPGHHLAQVYVDGREFSFPILPGEAGFYRDGDRFYTYPAA